MKPDRLPATANGRGRAPQPALSSPTDSTAQRVTNVLYEEYDRTLRSDPTVRPTVATSPPSPVVYAVSCCSFRRGLRSFSRLAERESRWSVSHHKNYVCKSSVI